MQRAVDDRSPGWPLGPAVRARLALESENDFGDVRVHTDGAAARLASDVDADAFTRGNHIYFGAGAYDPGSEPGRRLLRHELGHVVQQSNGDISSYERRLVPPAHASEAEAASGGSLRRRRRAVGAGSASIQRQPRAAPLSKGDADVLLWELDDVLFKETSRLITDTRDPRQAAFAKLFGAISGHDLKQRKLGGRERREIFDEAILALGDVLSYGSDRHRAALSRWRTKLFGEEASDRIKSSVVVEGKVLEIADERHPRERAEVLHELLPRIVQTLMLANEQLHRFGEGNNAHYERVIKSIEESPEYEHLEELLGHLEKDFHRPETVVHTIGALQALLGTIDGWLTLNDEEFQERLRTDHGTLPTVTSFVELVKIAVELGIGSASMTAVLAWGIAKAAGDAALAESAFSVAGKLGGALADAVAAVEIVHGILVLFDPHASAEEKEEAVVGVASGSAWFIGRRIGGAAIGGPASIAIVGPYLLFKEAAVLYWQGALGINSMLMSQTFEYMRDYGAHFASVGDGASRAALLLQKERDPRKAQALAAALAADEAMLATGLDDFLAHARRGGAKDMGWPGSTIPAPGNVEIIAEAFAPLQRYRDVKSGPKLVEAASHVLNRITWCLLNAREIEVASTHRGKHLSDVVHGPTKANDMAGAQRETVLSEIGAVRQMRIEFEAAGYRPEDARVVATFIPGLDLLWFVMGTNKTLTLGDLIGAADVVFEGTAVGGYPVKFTRAATTGKLAYEDVVSFTQDYFRAVARGRGQGAATMNEEAFVGMVDVYSQLLLTPLNEANLRG